MDSPFARVVAAAGFSGVAYGERVSAVGCGEAFMTGGQRRIGVRDARMDQRFNDDFGLKMTTAASLQYAIDQRMLGWTKAGCAPQGYMAGCIPPPRNALRRFRPTPKFA